MHPAVPRTGAPNGSQVGLNVPAVANVSAPNGQLTRYAIRVQPLLGREIVLAGCQVG
jgi:hypothetical protein